MKNAGNNSIEQKSIFSINARSNITNLNPNLQPNNQLHSLFWQLLPQESHLYPYLSKLLFLQLILRENILILTERRAQLKDIWVSINKKLNIACPDLYFMDEHTSIQSALNTKSPYHRVLFYDLSNISNSSLNILLNQTKTQLSILSIQPQSAKINPQLSTIFSCCFKDDFEEKFEHFVNNIHTKTNKNNFDKQKLNLLIKTNFAYLLESQGEAFLKPYLMLLREKMNGKKIIASHSKWKSMLRIVEFIGATKNEGCFKKFTLADCLIIPNLLAINAEQLSEINEVNETIMLELIPLFGVGRFITGLKDHFWLSNNTRQYYNSLADKLLNRISFYYPCSKYPDSAALVAQDGHLKMRIMGYDKKLMSDKYLPIEPQSKYRLHLQVQCEKQMIIHFGLACYDENKHFITPLQACRKSNTAVQIHHLQDNKIYITSQTKQNLQNWFNSQTFAFERCIGIYIDAKQDIIMDEQSYSKSKDSGSYISIGQDYIQLSSLGCKKINLIRHLIENGKTILMNHYEGGTYIIAQSQNKSHQQWYHCEVNFQGSERRNTGNSFFYDTKFVRIVLLINYNSGYPDYHIEDKNGIMYFRNVQWYKC